MYNGLLIDLVIITILVTAAASGLSRGTLREVLSLGAWLLVIGLTVSNFDKVAEQLDGLIADPALRAWTAVILIVLATAAVLALIDLGLRRLQERIGTESRDLLLGLVFGTLRGMLFVTLGVVLAHRTALPDRLAWSQSQFVGYAEALALTLRTHLPAPMAQRITLRGEGEAVRRVILARDSRGHYLANVWINGMPVNALVDTGATVVMIPAHMQDELDLKTGDSFPVTTATGQVIAHHTMIDTFKLGPIVLHDVEAAVVFSLHDSVLIGMSLLLRLHFQQTADGLLLQQTRSGL